MPKYIDADSLYERLEKRYHQIVESYSDLDAQQYIMGFGEAINALKNEPAATNIQEVRHAKWLADRFGMERAICSICGAVYEGGDSFRFCPKCGARMDLEDK